MVRRDEAERLTLQEEGRIVSCCAVPAGASPAPVSAGAPGSRPQARKETSVSQAGHQEPLRREQERGPQHEVKPAASSDSQSGSRAAHVTAKAMSVAPVSEGVAGPGGVWGAARVQGTVRNTGDPSALPQSGTGDSYKPKAKASAAQRESEGTVVPMRGAANNASGGKGPCGDRVVDGGKREGMIGASRSNHPDGRRPDDKVRQLQRRLWKAAKRQPGVPGGRVMLPSERSPVSRVPEIGTHGLKGGLAPIRVAEEG